MDVATIPVPRVPSPAISAPANARDPQGILPVPVPVTAPKPALVSLVGRAPRMMPYPASEVVFAGAKWFNRHVFKSPPPGAPVPAKQGSWTFSVIGDYGSGIKPLTDVTNNIARTNPELVLTTGDNVYWNGTEAEYRRKWDPPKMFGDIRANFPVMPTLGNHDIHYGADPYFKRFPELKGARYYSFDKGGVHFVALDTNESLAPGSPQLKWASKDLEASASDWKVVYFHHPMNSGFPIDNGPLKEYLAPVLAKTGVDLVFSGHEHNYSRTKPLNDNGMVEIVTGGGGESLHPFVAPIGKVFDYRDVDFGHVNIEVRDNELVGRYVVRDGKVRDTFVIPNLSPGVPATGTAAAEQARSGAAVAATAVAQPAT